MVSASIQAGGAAATVGRLMRQARLDAGLTQVALAQRLGTTQSVVSRWERGADEPRLSTLARVVRVCGHTLVVGIEPDDLDRAQIRQHLAMTAAERLAGVANVSRMLATAEPVR